MNESSQGGGHANESFRFVQLSDLHLSSIGLPNPFNLLNKRILGYLSWLRKRRHTHQRWVLDLALRTIQELEIDHFAITGDLTHIGLKHEFIQAREWLELLSDPFNITVIPGNHDLYVNEKWDCSFKYWENYLLDNDESKHRQFESEDALTRLNQIYPVTRVRNNTVFIAINSVFDAPWFRATGHIHERQLSRLKHLLNQEELQKYCKVLLIHHPVTLTDTPKRKSLLNYEFFNAFLQQHPVDLILHGHGHHSSTDNISINTNKQIPVIGMSSSSSISQEHGYQAEFLIFEVKKNHDAWNINKQSYTLDINEHRFIPGDIKNVITAPVCKAPTSV